MSESYYGEYKQRKQEGVWHFLNRLIVVLIVLAVITFVICLFLPQLRSQKELAAKQEQVRAELETQTALLELKTKQLDLLRNDRSYVEIFARDKLDLMKDGETIIRIEAQASQSAPPGATGTKLRAQP